MTTKPIVVFDLDGTLVDSGGDLIRTLNIIIAEKGLPEIGKDHLGDLVGQGALKMIERAYALHETLLDDETRADLHKRFLSVYEENIAVETRPFDGVLEVLEALSGRGTLMAVCTNKYEGLSRKLLDELSLTGFFAAICGSDTFPVRKPDPAHLTGTIEQAGGAAHRAVMIGDSATDINTAKAARIPVIAVPFGYSGVPVDTLGPDRIVSHYRDMLPAIDAYIGG
ncbi:MAG: HAD-IA family hydrolase [Pseudomonadota bacterium]